MTWLNLRFISYSSYTILAAKWKLQPVVERATQNIKVNSLFKFYEIDINLPVIFKHLYNSRWSTISIETEFSKVWEVRSYRWSCGSSRVSLPAVCRCRQVSWPLPASLLAAGSDVFGGPGAKQPRTSCVLPSTAKLAKTSGSQTCQIKFE